MTVRTPVYLDHHATTPIDPRVLDLLEMVQREHFGNPSSAGHAFGWAAARIVAEAREKVASAGLTNVHFQQGDIFSLTFEPNSFDYVFVCFVLV